MNASYDKSSFKFLRNLHPEFHNGCTSLYSQESCVRVHFPPHSQSALVIFNLQMKALITPIPSPCGGGIKTVHPSTASLPKWLKWPRICQAEAKSQELHLSPPHGYRGPSIWAILPCFPRRMSRKIEQLGFELVLIWHACVADCSITYVLYNANPCLPVSTR